MDIVTFGEIMGLFVARPNEPLRGATEFHRSIAGAEATVAIALSRLGHQAGWFGRLGDDEFGHDALDTLRANGVDVSRATVSADAPTGLLIRDAHPRRRIVVRYYRSGSAASHMTPDDLDADYLAGARLLHITGITPALSPSCSDTVRAAIGLARQNGVAVSFDPNIRRRLWPDGKAAGLLGKLAAQADIVLASADEATELTGHADRERAAQRLLGDDARLVVIKSGVDGAWASDGTREWSVRSIPATVVDPVGAGDAFDAGFLSGWLAGHDVRDCLVRGAALGALGVQSLGDIAGLPHPADLAAILDDISEVDR